MTIHRATPVMLAAQNDNRDVLEELIQQGARLDLRAIDGRTALEAAQAAGHEESVRLLENATEAPPAS